VTGTCASSNAKTLVNNTIALRRTSFEVRRRSRPIVLNVAHEDIDLYYIVFVACCLSCFGFLDQIDTDPKETPVLTQIYRPLTHGPTLTQISIRSFVKPNAKRATGIVTMAAPSDYSGQVLVSLEVRSDPPSALKSWNLVKRADKINSVIQAQVSLEAGGATIWYTALVLTPAEPVLRTMKRPLHGWTTSTASVQSNSREITFLSAKLAHGTSSQDEFVQRAVMWVARNKPNQVDTQAWDAKSGLASGGSSANRANLCIALLRAHGIPARTVAYMPTWASGSFGEQWLTEYWSDDGAWVMVDPTIGVLHPGRNSVIVLATASLEDENLAYEGRHIRANRPGTPFMSAIELSAYLNIGTPRNSPMNEVHLLKTFPNRSDSMVMPAGYRRSLKVIAAAQKGENATFDQKELMKAIANGTFSFASLLEGRPQ